MAIVTESLWTEMMQQHEKYGLNAAQISRALKCHGFYISRQAVWSRMEREKRKKYINI